MIIYQVWSNTPENAYLEQMFFTRQEAEKWINAHKNYYKFMPLDIQEWEMPNELG